MAKGTSGTFHHIQLTGDRRFREALDQQVSMERLATGVVVYPASMVLDAMLHIGDRRGDEVAACITGIDLSLNARLGAVRIAGTEWRHAIKLAKRLRGTTARPSAIDWSPRTVIIAALYCYATEH